MVNPAQEHFRGPVWLAAALEASGDIWSHLEASAGIWRHLEAYGGIWRKKLSFSLCFTVFELATEHFVWEW